jgi:hypothetical protein
MYKLKAYLPSIFEVAELLPFIVGKILAPGHIFKNKLNNL